MRLLLDSQAYVYSVQSPEMLPSRARQAMEDADNELLLSIVSVWELQLKVMLGRITFNPPLVDGVLLDCQLGLSLLAISLPHVHSLATLPAVYCDPFDRMLIAQALSEQLTMSRVTA